ncbi:MAG: glycoside hydrolase family 15 protein, partial [Verrucomicrobia bacterium]|nr:glycoside hydrolase family 15 protein [Verrucomicrobiota bacterium]
MSYQPIENYGVIGDLETIALVGRHGSIDFMCFPAFDSPAIFARLLDDQRGGYFSIAPAGGDFKTRQRYFPDTNILLTRFLGEDGIAEISDFMPMQHLGHQHNLVRRVKVVRGRIKLRMVCAPKFDYGRAGHTVRKISGGVTFVPDVKKLPAVLLRGSVPLRVENGAAIAEFELGADGRECFVLEEGGKESPSAS